MNCLSRNLSAMSLFWVAMSVVVFPHNSARAQTPTSAWGLRYGDRFVVDMAFRKTSRFQLDDGESQQVTSADLLQVAYEVREADPAGNLTVEARLARCLRADDTATQSLSLDASQQLQLLQGAAISLRVAPDGVVDAVAQEDLRTLINQLSGLDSENSALLTDMLSPQMIKSVLGRPFWFVAPMVRGEDKTEWTRQDSVSLGLLGDLQATVQCKVSGTGDERPVTCTGDARFVPRVETRADAARQLRVGEASVRVTRFEGRGVMNTDQTGRQEQSEYRPYFDELTLDIEFEGNAVLLAGEKSVALSFEQQQEIRLKLSSWRTGRPQLVPGGFEPPGRPE
jgi:hypothetical protein